MEGAEVQLSLPFIQVALGYNQCDVVMLFPRAELLNFSYNRSDQGLGRDVTIALDCLNQPILAEFFARRVERLRNSIGVQDERVSVKDVAFFYGALPFLEQSEHGAGGFKPFDFPTATKFVNTLIKNGVTVLRAARDFEVAGKRYACHGWPFQTGWLGDVWAVSRISKPRG